MHTCYICHVIPAPSAQEVARENLVKGSITDNLKQTIKAVQKLYVASEEPIYR